MPYYRGDYVGGQSNYYRGDPFLGALIGTAARSVGLGKLASKAGRWVAQRVTGQSLRRGAAAAAGVGITAATLPGLPSRGSNLPAPIQIGPVGIDPLSALPGGKPLLTFGSKKYRRMNPLNPKALRRAIRRAEGFERFAKSTMNALVKSGGGRKFKRVSKPRSK